LLFTATLAIDGANVGVAIGPQTLEDVQAQFCAELATAAGFCHVHHAALGPVGGLALEFSLDAASAVEGVAQGARMPLLVEDTGGNTAVLAFVVSSVAALNTTACPSQRDALCALQGGDTAACNARCHCHFNAAHGCRPGLLQSPPSPCSLVGSASPGQIMFPSPVPN